MMSASMHRTSYASGPAWQAASLPYVGGELAMAVVVPDDGSDLADVERAFTEGGLGRLLTGFRAERVLVEIPRWTFRSRVPLNAPLQQLGMPTAFTDAADFSAMTAAERLQIAAVLHQGFIAVDEAGTEAAAATAVATRVAAAPAPPRLVVRADRAFLFVIHDVPTRTPLFIGRVSDPAE